MVDYAQPMLNPPTGRRRGRRSVEQGSDRVSVVTRLANASGCRYLYLFLMFRGAFQLLLLWWACAVGNGLDWLLYHISHRFTISIIIINRIGEKLEKICILFVLDGFRFGVPVSPFPLCQIKSTHVYCKRWHKFYNECLEQRHRCQLLSNEIH